MSKSQGKIFEDEFKASLIESGFVSYRIPDKLVPANGMIYSEESEADFWAFIAGGDMLEGCLIECKSCSGKSIPFNRLKDHQNKALVDFDSLCSHSHGFVAVNFYDIENKRAYNVAYVMSIRTWNEIEAQGTRKSIPIKTFQEREDVMFCPRIKGSKYDTDILMWRLTHGSKTI